MAAAAALVVAKVFLSLQLSVQRALRSRAAADGSVEGGVYDEDEEADDEDNEGDEEEEAEDSNLSLEGSRGGCGRRTRDPDGAGKLWRKMLAKVPRELK